MCRGNKSDVANYIKKIFKYYNKKVIYTDVKIIF